MSIDVFIPSRRQASELGHPEYNCQMTVRVIKSVVLSSTHCRASYHQMCRTQTPSSWHPHSEFPVASRQAAIDPTSPQREVSDTLVAFLESAFCKFQRLGNRQKDRPYKRQSPFTLAVHKAPSSRKALLTAQRCLPSHKVFFHTFNKAPYLLCPQGAFL